MYLLTCLLLFFFFKCSYFRTEVKELKGQEEEISHGGRLQDGHMIFLMWAGACVWVYHTGGGASSGLQRQTGLTSFVFLPVQVHTYTHAYVHLHTPNKHRHCLAVVVHIFFFFLFTAT